MHRQSDMAAGFLKPISSLSLYHGLILREGLALLSAAGMDLIDLKHRRQFHSLYQANGSPVAGPLHWSHHDSPLATEVGSHHVSETRQLKVVLPEIELYFCYHQYVSNMSIIQWKFSCHVPKDACLCFFVFCFFWLRVPILYVTQPQCKGWCLWWGEKTEGCSSTRPPQAHDMDRYGAYLQYCTSSGKGN